MLVPRRWWCSDSESGNSVYRSGCVVKGVCRFAVTPRRRAASEAAGVPRRANMTPQRRDTGRPSRRQCWRRQVVNSRGSVTPANLPTVCVSGSSQPREQCFKSVDTQCLVVAGVTGSPCHRHTLLRAPQSTSPGALRSLTSRHHAHYSWPRRAWLATLVLVAAVAVLGTPAAANTPPRFVLDGQSEIVIRLTEGEATPVGEYP